MLPPGTLRPGVTVLGNVAVDRVNDDPPSAGGCPSFAGAALDAAGGIGRIVTQLAPIDVPLFADVLQSSRARVDVLLADSTSAFGLRYDGDDRVMTVDAIGPVWDGDDLALAAPNTTWVHVAPLLRSDFPAASLAALAADGHVLAYDGQGLVRAPSVGPLTVDAHYDPALLDHLTVLKLASDEAVALIGSATFSEEHAHALGVPEILVTDGSRGCDLFVAGARHHVPPPWRVKGVQTTGAGDLFTVAYVAARAAGDAPLVAAQAASSLVSEQLEVRREQRAAG